MKHTKETIEKALMLVVKQRILHEYANGLKDFISVKDATIHAIITTEETIKVLESMSFNSEMPIKTNGYDVYEQQKAILNYLKSKL